MVDLDKTRAAWTRLGADDPLWAVLVEPGKRRAGWEPDEFLETGRADVARTVAWLATLGLPTSWRRALDFGCGAGRLTQALVPHAGRVVGVDVSPTMLDAARRLDRSGACEFVLTDAADLSQFPDGSFDLVYSALVLQHLPRAAIARYLAEFVRVLSPDGVAVVQVPTGLRLTAKAVAWRLVPYPAIAWAQRRLLRYPAPMRMTTVPAAAVTRLVARAGGDIVGQIGDDGYGTDWRLTRFAVRRG